MLIRHRPKLTEADVTPRHMVLNRRALLAGAGAAALAAATGGRPRVAMAQGGGFETVPSRFSIGDPPTGREHVTTYNNFYEFGMDKADPAKHAGALTTRPWSVRVDGLVGKPAEYALEDIVSARYVAFETLVRPEEMPGQRGLFQPLDWPYVEGLRLDEAMHPLTILAVGLYGEELPNQNGAPLRLVVPWKYGFKSIKSIVRITLTEEQPPTTWNIQAPNEYGFYSNVNPEVRHPRWSQATERVVGAGVFAARRDTEMFNGYAEEVGPLYAGMDLRRFY